MDRVTGLLKKYGQIPESATLETKLVKMVINSRTGLVSGTVLAGNLRGMELGDLSMEQIESLLAYAPDKDTKSILEAYKSFRAAQM